MLEPFEIRLLEAAELLTREATVPPWHVPENENDIVWVTFTDPDTNEGYICDPGPTYIVADCDMDGSLSQKEKYTNARFIVFARKAITLLVSMVKKYANGGEQLDSSKSTTG